MQKLDKIIAIFFVAAAATLVIFFFYGFYANNNSNEKITQYDTAKKAHKHTQKPSHHNKMK